MTKIKIYGERNTNTNYLSKLIELNLKAIEIPGVVPPIVMKIQKILPGNEMVRDLYFSIAYGKNLGWKHTCIKPVEELCRYRLFKEKPVFITITKNPYSWLLSLHRRHYHQYYSDKPSFEVFLQREWKTIGRDNVKTSPITPIELWNIKNKSYLQLDGNNTLHFTTEEIFHDPAEIIQRISNFHSIERKSEKFVNYERSTKNERKDSSYYRHYYLSERWRGELSKEAISIINESINKELMSYFGYNLLS